jgi:hypothetical protein
MAKLVPFLVTVAAVVVGMKLAARLPG